MTDQNPDHVPGLDALELRQLRHLLAVADAHSFTRAAGDLHLVQQALSSSIRRLEQQLGVTLFLRTTRRVELTSAGEVLVEEARVVMAAAAHALERVRLASEGRTGRITIGFSTAAGGVGVVRDIIRTFALGAPDVEVVTTEHDFADPSAGLADGAVQAAFIFGPLPVEGLASITLLEEPRLLALAPEHPFASMGAVTAGDLANLPWLRVPAPRGPWPDAWFPRTGSGRMGPQIRTADEWVTAIETGRGHAFTMPSVMRNFATARLVVVPVDGVPPAQILLAWRASSPGPLARALVATAQEVVAASWRRSASDDALDDRWS